MANDGIDNTAMNRWVVSGQGSFHLPIPVWGMINPDHELGPIIKDTIQMLDAEVATFGQKSVRVRCAEGSHNQRIWTCMTIAHREMYYAGVRSACEEYANYQIALRLWIQRDLICYSFGIPRASKAFPFPKPNVTGNNIDQSFLHVCCRINTPLPEEVEPDETTMMVDDLRFYLEGIMCRINASLQLIQGRVDITQNEAGIQTSRFHAFAHRHITQIVALRRQNAQLQEMLGNQANQGGHPENSPQN
ncbi:hypothetical protein E0Z10_g10155 [Xylaria hypoxylon]|uniref:Uncharacterized protein n=1 Tax=Xylaria hypoxylon TaxID=37992 RepID=A0A4Z0YIP3_9PEZI|nr:hypothetical protein E0Z10_g10155 [Xylaria hypoxylon]